MQKIGADQLALDLCEIGMRREGVFHFVGTRLERLQQVAVPALEILKNLGQLVVRRLGIERKDPLDDMVRPRLVGRVEIARFGRRLERAHDHPGRVGTQIESLTVQEGGFWHNTLGFRRPVGSGRLV